MKERLAPFLVLLEARYAPLLFAVSPQSYAVYLWLFPAPYSLTGEVFAVLGALGFEFIYVGAIAWAEEDRANWWTWGTAAVALIFSVAVAYYVYRSQGAWAFLHAGFPLVAFAYTMQLHGMTASDRRNTQPTTAQVPLGALPERLELTKQPDVPKDTTTTTQAPTQALSLNGHSEPLNPLILVQPHRYECPHCQAVLANKQAVGAAVKNGYCLGCKAERKSA